MGMINIQAPASIKGAGSGSITASNRKVFIMDIVTLKSIKYLKVPADGLPNLEFLKDGMREKQKAKEMDFGVKGHLIPNYADANVRSSLITLVHSGQMVKLPNGEMQKHKLQVIDIKGLAIVGNPQVMRWAIAKETDKKLKALMQKNYEFFMRQPRRESYYSSK